MIPGSSTLTVSLLQAGLLDELRIMVYPVILGQGRSLFAGARHDYPQTAEDPAVHLCNVLLCYQPITSTIAAEPGRIPSAGRLRPG